jgi:hypothetical protein
VLEVTFLTLFLGLVAGPQPVGVAAPNGTAAVELLLDGARAARFGAPPWRGQIDFGGALLPHHLVARALDKEGRELGRADQWLNLPRERAEVQIVIDGAVGERPRRVHLVWQIVTNEMPTTAQLTLDGKPLALDAQHGAVLPPAGAPGGATRVLSAELRWAGGVVARKDVAVGRDFGDEVSTDLTAVPVWPRDGGELPDAAQLGGWLTAEGKALQVDAVESGGEQQLLAVRDPAAVARLLRLPAANPRLERSVTLDGDARLQFLWPVPHAVAAAQGGGPPSQLFDVSQAYDAATHGLIWLVARVEHGVYEAAAPHLADAVAMAALNAYAGGRRRAVLLVLAPESAADGSQYSPAVVRGYCAALHVPLFVWSVGAPSAALKAAWGGITDITSAGGLARTVKTLRRALDTQRIVMVEGQPLPQSLALGGAAAAAITLDSAH